MDLSTWVKTPSRYRGSRIAISVINYQEKNAHPSTLNSTKSARSFRSTLMYHSPEEVPHDNKAELLRHCKPEDHPILGSVRMSLMIGAETRESKAAIEQVRNSLSHDVRQALTSYTPTLPKADVAKIREFVESAIVLTLPLTSYTVTTLLRPAMHFVHWAFCICGAELDASVIFTQPVIEKYVHETMPTLTDGTKRNYRAWLLRVAESVNPDANPNNPMPLAARALEIPYTDDELDGLDRWAAGQRTAYLRENAEVFLALGIGAGLSAKEMVQVRAKDISADANGAVIVTVAGEPGRTVVVTARYEQTLSHAASNTPASAFVFLPKRTRTTNDVVSAFVSRTERPRGTPTVRSRKMRNTWLVLHLTNRVDVTTLMQAAGLQSLESISRLAQFVPSPSDTERTAMLRGAL